LPQCRLASSSATSLCGAGDDAAQCSALVALANALSFTSWPSFYTSSWLRGTSYCTWAGLTCGSGKAVTGLQLIGVGVGAWPSSVSSLSNLRSFNYEPSLVGDTSGVGSLPTGMASWTSLTFLRIDCSRMTGCFSGALDSISSLPALQSLSLRGLGSVTKPSVWSLPALTSLMLHDTGRLAGTLPMLPAVQSLDVSGAGFTALAAMPASMQSIAISNTPLAGAFPDLSGLTALTSITISGTSLSGTVPSASCSVLSGTR